LPASSVSNLLIQYPEVRDMVNDMANVTLNRTGSGLLSSVYLHAHIPFLYMLARTGHNSSSQSRTSRGWLVRELSILRNFGDCRIAYILKGVILGAVPTKKQARSDDLYT